MEYLFRHFRPEFVQKYKKPLCSDAFSPFILPRVEIAKKLDAEIREIHRDIVEAEEYLHNEVIPYFVSIVHLLPPCFDQVSIVIVLHIYGINMRYLGEVLDLCIKKQEYMIASKLMIEMVSRVIKDIIKELLRTKMKEFRYSGEGIYRREVVNLLNTFANEEDDYFWNFNIYNRLLDKFENNIGPM